jgi:hypothetical protein
MFQLKEISQDRDYPYSHMQIANTKHVLVQWKIKPKITISFSLDSQRLELMPQSVCRECYCHI